METDNQQSSKREIRSQRREEKLKARETQKRKRKTQRVLTWGIALAILAAAVYGVIKFSGTTSSSIDGGTLAETDQISSTDHVKGNRDSSVVIVEYSDFECPACAQYYPIVKSLNEEFGESIAIVYRHFPLITIHRSADLAARATEAAALQGKFWEMHDMLFENQRVWTTGQARDTIVQYAEELGLDLGQFETDIDSDVVKEKVRADMLSGQRAQVNSTPSFFINGEKIANPRSYNEFAELIRIELGPEAKNFDESMGETESSADSVGSDSTVNEE